MTNKDLAGRARLAANILVEVWQTLGPDYANYDKVWAAKEYLYEAADTLEQTDAEPIADWRPPYDCLGCDCPKQRCDSYQPDRKCCPECDHT